MLVPSASRERLAGDWCDRLRATARAIRRRSKRPRSRQETIAAALAAARISPSEVPADVVADFLALGYAHLQVELLTRAMQYTPVLDAEQFTSAVVAAAQRRLPATSSQVRDELARAFDLLADARNHVYSVDFYVVDVTLLAASTLGESLRAKLASGSPTSLLSTRRADRPNGARASGDAGRAARAIEAGTACVVGGRFATTRRAAQSPEAMLAELRSWPGCGRAASGARVRSLRPVQLDVLAAAAGDPDGHGFRGALHAAFDGGQLPRAEQRKTRWGRRDGPWIEALSATPLDAARPETWLEARRAGRRHDRPRPRGDDRCSPAGPARAASTTTTCAGRPLRPRAAESSSRSKSTFASRARPTIGRRFSRASTLLRRRSRHAQIRFRRGSTLIAATSLNDSPATWRRVLIVGCPASVANRMRTAESRPMSSINPGISCTQFVALDPLDFSGDAAARPFRHACLPDVPGCGYAELAAAPLRPPVPLADGRTLRNERWNSPSATRPAEFNRCAAHRDRGTRVSQRLVFQARTGRKQSAADWAGATALETQMVADASKSRGTMRSSARLRRTAGCSMRRAICWPDSRRRRVCVRAAAGGDRRRRARSRAAARGRPGSRISPAGWRGATMPCPFAAASSGRPRNDIASGSSRRSGLKIDDGIGSVTCFGFGLPFHRRVGPTWLDTLLVVAGEERRDFNSRSARSQRIRRSGARAATAGTSCRVKLPGPSTAPRGWFLHVGAKNLIVHAHRTAVRRPAPASACGLLETEGRERHTKLQRFAHFAPRRHRFSRQRPDWVLSVVDGRANSTSAHTAGCKLKRSGER